MPAFGASNIIAGYCIDMDSPLALCRARHKAKKTNGRKRHVVVDTMGLLLAVLITTAAVQDRDGARRVLDRLRFTMPSVALIWADGGYAGPQPSVALIWADGGYAGPQLLTWARTILRVTVQIVRNPLGIPLPGGAPPLGRGADLRMDRALPPTKPRLRTPPPTLRSNDQMGDDRADDPPDQPDTHRQSWQPSTIH